MGELTKKYAHLTEQVAQNLLGEPTRQIATAWRYGTKGSLCVHISGPRHGTFRDFENDESGDLVDLVVREKGCTKAEAIDWLNKFGGSAVKPVVVPPTPPPQQQFWSKQAQSIWDKAKPLQGTLGEKYLSSRKCFVPKVEELKFLPQNGNYPPAIVARVTDIVTGNPMTLHFIRIDPNSPTRLRKKFLKGHKSEGGVVRLQPLGTDLSCPLGLAEGIENALSVIRYGQSPMTDFQIGPVWAALTAGNLGKLNKPPLLSDLIIWADNGDAGMNNASKLAERWGASTPEVRIIPPEKADDWNDDLIEELA